MATHTTSRTTTHQTANVSARERLLAAADELFYSEGVQTVGIDRIVKHAGVAKASLYNTFGSKEELIRAYLEKRYFERRDWFIAELSAINDPTDRLLGAFDLLSQSFSEPDFNGCAFANATAEARPSSAARRVSNTYRAWVRAMFLELSEGVGAPNPSLLARQLHQLYDGAALAARLDFDPSAGQVARQAAASLIGAQSPITRPRRRTPLTAPEKTLENRLQKSSSGAKHNGISAHSS